MHKKPNKTLLSAGLTACLLIMGAGSASIAQTYTLKLHQFLPPQANVPKHVLKVWADKVEKESGNRIKIDHYPSMQLGGKPPALYGQAVDGIADIIWTVPGYTPGRFPHGEVFELPFMMTNAKATSRAYWDIHEKYMKNKDYKDAHIIAVWVHGPGLIHSNRPITKLQDLKGIKLRAPTRIITGLFEKLGATSIGMPVPGIPEALSRGVIEAAVIPWEVVPALKVQELVSNHTDFGNDALYTTTFVMAMNKAAYAKLPNDLKAVIDANSGREVSGWAGDTQAAADGPSRALTVKNGNNLISLPKDEVARWRVAAEPVVAEWLNDMKAKGIDGSALLRDARSLIKKYTR